MLMAKESYFVQKRPDGNWEVLKSNAERASAVVPTQKEAIERGRELAKELGTELVIKGEDGKIREKNSYGNDPNPPKG